MWRVAARELSGAFLAGFLALEPGQVYRITTSCDTVKGDTVLRLRDPCVPTAGGGSVLRPPARDPCTPTCHPRPLPPDAPSLPSYDIQVAYNDDSNICSPTQASNIDYIVPCRYNALDVRDFVLIQGCFGDGACEATTTISYSPVMQPIVCGAPPPAPPGGHNPPPPAAPAPPLPVGCAPYNTKDDKSVLCFLSLSEGYTYRIYTDCPSVKGDTDLMLLNNLDQEVAYNDNSPFCGDESIYASLIEYFVPCGDGYNPRQPFHLQQGCGSSGGACGAQVVVEYSPKVPPIVCPNITSTRRFL